MLPSITTALVGVIICALGVMNMRGNISSLHSYHRHRVSPEDVKPFGKLVGLGTLIVGISVLVFSALFIAFTLTNIEIYTVIGTVAMIIGMTVGIVISFYAMKKYNGGIF
ncbi:MAG: hypothetical protein J6K85_01680 [Clostridia bacterium]|nr:hypothetical protein [Clostridia bacterium]